MHPNCEYASQGQLNRHLKTHERPPRFKKPRNTDRHKVRTCPFCPFIGGKHLTRHMKQKHDKIKEKGLTSTFAQMV